MICLGISVLGRLQIRIDSQNIKIYSNNNNIMEITKNNPQRILWVDAMRGFSIVLVVLGHVNNLSIRYENDIFLAALFSSFRMPLFFFVSGFFSYRILNWWNKDRIIDILKRKIHAQIICTLVFFSLYQLTICNNHITFVDGFGGYWFTIVLFQMYIIYLCLSIISRLIKLNITFISLVIISIMCLGVLIFHKSDNLVWNILSWNNFTKYFQFFALGIICSRFRIRFFDILQNPIFKTVMIIGWIISIVLCFNTEFKTIYPLLHKIIHDTIIRYCALLSIVIMFYHSSKNIDYSKKGKNIQIIGKRTLDIYMIHFFLLPKLTFLRPYLESGNMFVIQLVVSISISIIIVVICIVISNIIRLSPYLAYWLFGVKEKTI